jgi:hypothetical protein
VIAWMPVSQRSRTLAERLDFDLLLLGRRGFRRPWSAAFAYPVLAWRTIAALVRRRPPAVLAVVPPIVVPLVVMPVARMLGARVALDLHSAALLDRRWRWSLPILRRMAAASSAAVVTLESLREVLRSRGRVIVLPDPLPTMGGSGLDAADAFPGAAAVADGDLPTAVAVCGWADDEPTEALVDAARGAPWRLLITGRPTRQIELPDNVRLSGYLDDPAYAAVLRSADAVVVLTTREDTLLSGAWEATALARPLLVSGTRSLRETFGEEADYSGPAAAELRRAIDSVLADPTAAQRAAARRRHWLTRSDEALEQLRVALGSGSVTDRRGGRTAAG